MVRQIVDSRLYRAKNVAATEFAVTANTIKCGIIYVVHVVNGSK